MPGCHGKVITITIIPIISRLWGGEGYKRRRGSRTKPKAFLMATRWEDCSNVKLLFHLVLWEMLQNKSGFPIGAFGLMLTGSFYCPDNLAKSLSEYNETRSDRTHINFCFCRKIHKEQQH